MANLNGFNANEVPPKQEFTPLPAGHYDACIVESEMKPTKNGTGHYLELKLQVLTGPFEKRNLWVRLNLDNPNDQAVGMARGELSSICRALGVMTPNDSAELHNQPMAIHVKLKPNKQTNELENVVASYHPDGYKPSLQGGAAPVVPTTPAAAKPVPSAAAGAPTAGAASWMKK